MTKGWNQTEAIPHFGSILFMIEEVLARGTVCLIMTTIRPFGAIRSTLYSFVTFSLSLSLSLRFPPIQLKFEINYFRLVSRSSEELYAHLLDPNKEWNENEYLLNVKT